MEIRSGVANVTEREADWDEAGNNFRRASGWEPGGCTSDMVTKYNIRGTRTVLADPHAATTGSYYLLSTVCSPAAGMNHGDTEARRKN